MNGRTLRRIFEILVVAVRTVVGIVFGFVFYIIVSGLFVFIARQFWLLLTQRGDQPLPSLLQNLWDLVGIGLEIIFASCCILAVMAYIWDGIEQIRNPRA